MRDVCTVYSRHNILYLVTGIARTQEGARVRPGAEEKRCYYILYSSRVEYSSRDVLYIS